MAGAVRQELKQLEDLQGIEPEEGLNGRGCPSGIETVVRRCVRSLVLLAKWQGLSVRN